ncbi:MAG: DUF2851 family protein [Sphingobacteriales bacterium]|nr:MAG: DUF2851 family protein [Sphingobacteriales bacterium]
MMQEALFQTLWQYSLYRPADLKTTAGEPVTVLHPGLLNRHAGPDFSAARIRIGETLLVGAVELHLRSSDWIRHRHSTDEAYQSVILHVVLQDDAPDAAPGIPVLELQRHIDPGVIRQYTHLVGGAAELPCAEAHHQASALVKTSWLTRMLTQRWERRFAEYNTQLDALNGDFTSLLYERLAIGLGFKINAQPFGELAQSLPLALLIKNQPHLLTLEALLFGQSGLLPEKSEETYVQTLKQEYAYLRHKYALTPVAGHTWKLLRMRPANFPTLRIAQLAQLLHRMGDRLSDLLDASTPEAVMEQLQVPVSDYWQTHATFKGTTHAPQEKHLGAAAAENLVINVIAPLKCLRATHSGSEREREAAETFLDQLHPEQNSLIRPFTDAGWIPENASQSQGMLELYQTHCSRKDCLNCAIGLKILRTPPER